MTALPQRPPSPTCYWHRDGCPGDHSLPSPRPLRAWITTHTCALRDPNVKWDGAVLPESRLKMARASRSRVERFYQGVPRSGPPRERTPGFGDIGRNGVTAKQLVVLDALRTEGSVTAAARKLKKSTVFVYRKRLVANGLL